MLKQTIEGKEVDFNKNPPIEEMSSKNKNIEQHLSVEISDKLKQRFDETKKTKFKPEY